MRTLFKQCGVALVASLGLLASTGVHADIIAVGGVVGSSAVRIEACYLFNAGTNRVRITAAQIRGEDGSTPSFSFNSCGPFPNAFLDPGRICGINTNSGTHQAWACRFQTQGRTPNVRGVMDLRNSGNETLFVVPMSSSNTGGF